MAPSYSRQLLAIAVPTLAVLITYFWFKRKRGVKRSDPGESAPIVSEAKSSARFEQAPPAPSPAYASCKASASGDAVPVEPSAQLPPVAGSVGNASPFGSPGRTSPRPLSTPSTPIDIVIPRELRSQRTSPAVISDEDLDIEIEKVKSMRSYSNEHSMHKLSGGSDSVDASTTSSLSHTPTKKDRPKPQSAGDAMPAAGKPAPASHGKPKNPKATSGQERKKKSKMAAKVEEKHGGAQLPEEVQPAAKEEKTLEAAATAPKEEVPASNNNSNSAQSEELRQSSERDSANHSPADVMLASPSLSCISDNHSEGSSDSGKGGSEVATPPSRTPAGDSSIPLIYEFTIPQLLVGKLIGRYGTFVAEIKEKTRAHIVIKKHPCVNKLKLCVIEGSQSEIDNALVMIRERFPLKKHPEMTLEQVSLTNTISSVPISTDHIYLKLVEGVNNDTIVSCMMSPSHFFLQQPTHPSFPHLQILSRYMMACYSNPESPTLPKPILPNTVCVSETMGEWCRVIILSTDEENDTSHITYLDYGGYAVVSNSQLKQIRGDFLLLPFQAAEAYLANVRPIGGDEAPWCDEAYQMVGELTKGATVSCTQIAEYTDNGIPLVLIYILVGSQEIVFLNDELVKRGYAEYIQPTPEVQEYESAVAADGAVAPASAIVA